MSKYSELIGRRLGMTSEETNLLLTVVPMHDIGKIGIPDNILLKPGKLDKNEWEIMKTHCEKGAQILGNDNIEIIREARICALTHHEKWDGSGYPKGLKGKEIPLYGRIAAVADVFDALTNERPYKKAWSTEKAVKLLKDEKGSHFDPDIVDAFIDIFPEILKIKEKFKD